jgi:predicted nucleic acid-binding protein
MKLYLDNCCYNRPFDDQSQERIHLESTSVLAVVKRARAETDTILGSKVLSLEISQICNTEKREKVEVLYGIAGKYIPFSAEIEMRAAEIMAVSSIRSFDALHIASAEKGEADYLLTTDDRLEKACANLPLSVKVINPLRYIAEVISDE